MVSILSWSPPSTEISTWRSFLHAPYWTSLHGNLHASQSFVKHESPSDFPWLNLNTKITTSMHRWLQYVAPAAICPSVSPTPFSHHGSLSWETHNSILRLLSIRDEPEVSAPSFLLPSLLRKQAKNKNMQTNPEYTPYGSSPNQHGHYGPTAPVDLQATYIAAILPTNDSVLDSGLMDKISEIQKNVKSAPVMH